MTAPQGCWHWECLDPVQRDAATVLTSALCSRGAFLAGGSALALRFGHRRSRDLDWFTTQAFNSLILAEELLVNVPLTNVRTEPNTLHAELNGVPFSVIRFGYRVDPPDDTGIAPIAAVRTSSCMKLLAIVNRGYKRDFIDLACLLRHGSHLPMLMTWAQTDLPALSRETMLRALTWFEEADSQPMPACVPGWDWEQVKNEIKTAVRNAALK